MQLKALVALAAFELIPFTSRTRHRPGPELPQALPDLLAACHDQRSSSGLRQRYLEQLQRQGSGGPGATTHPGVMGDVVSALAAAALASCDASVLRGVCGLHAHGPDGGSPCGQAAVLLLVQAALNSAEDRSSSPRAASLFNVQRALPRLSPDAAEAVLGSLWAQGDHQVRECPWACALQLFRVLSHWHNSTPLRPHFQLCHGVGSPVHQTVFVFVGLCPQAIAQLLAALGSQDARLALARASLQLLQQPSSQGAAQDGVTISTSLEGLVRAIAATAIAAGDGATLAAVAGLQQLAGSPAGSSVVIQLVRGMLLPAVQPGTDGSGGSQEQQLLKALDLPAALSALQPGVGLVMVDLLFQGGDLQVCCGG